MIGVFKKIWSFAGSEQKNIRNSIIWGFINAVFYAAQLGALFMILDALVTGYTVSSASMAAIEFMD